MANQMLRIAESLRLEASAEIADGILASCGEMPLDADNCEQGRWIRMLIDKMDSTISRETCSKVMENCGRKCIPDQVISDAAQIYAESTNIDDFLDKLNSRHINGGIFSWKDDVIYVRYDKCYCGIVNQTNGLFSRTYCNCSLGWNKTFFESVLAKNVDVKLIQSVISGGDMCLFEVRILG